MRGEAVDGCPKLRAVVGVGKVAEFVDADVVCDVIGCADEPPVEADAGGVAADAPEGFGVGEGGRGGNEGGGAGVVFEARQQDFRRPDLDVAAVVDGQGRLNALIPNPFGEGVGGCGGGRGLGEGAAQERFVVGQPLGEGAMADERGNVDADGVAGYGAQDEVFLGAAFEPDSDGLTV